MKALFEIVELKVNDVVTASNVRDEDDTQGSGGDL